MPDLLKKTNLHRIYRGRKKTPAWVAAVAVIAAAAAVVAALRMTVWKGGTAESPSPGVSAGAPAEEVSPAATHSPDPTPTPEVKSTPTPEDTPVPSAEPVPAQPFDPAGPEMSQPAPTPAPVPVNVSPSEDGVLWVPEGTAADVSWFDDAVMIGDSRMDGFRMYSGVTGADFIVRTGMSVYDVANEKEVVKVGDAKYSVYHILSQKQYGKVYLSMGVNELGYYDPAGYGEKFGDIIDRVRDIQPGATVYVLTIIPVNTQKCKDNNQKKYVTNEMVRQYNEALIQTAAEKNVLLIDAGAALVDETGEVPAELSADGVHFKKQGYAIWRDYLLCHTGL